MTLTADLRVLLTGPQCRSHGPIYQIGIVGRSA
jgi:hypothetical protein